MNKNNHAKNATRLVVTTAIASAMLLVYGRSAYAGTCTETPAASGVWICSGAAGADSTQFPIGSPVTVTTTPGFGINTPAGSALVIRGNGGTTFTDNNASVITGADRGLYSANNVSGDLTVTTNGIITGTSNIGIDARNFGTGDTTVTTTGSVTGLGFSGIYARNAATANDLTVNVVNATGGANGVLVNNYGNGETTITATGTITGTGVAGNNGLIIQNFASSTNATITASGNVTGGQDGIWITNDGSGTTSITSTVSATGILNNGIYARATGTDITIEANNASGGTNGIFARNLGAGETSVTATGVVTGTNNIGIQAHNIAAGSNLTINAVDVSGGATGILARNYGNGETNITATGSVGGTNSNGIYARNFATATDLTINAAAVSGGQFGINSRNYGTGETNITATGTVTGTGAWGIYARNAGAASTDLTVNAVDVSGGQFGISARNYGVGETAITTTGTVTGSTGWGILARNAGAASTDLTINAANVSGVTDGIIALNAGTGSTSVTATGTVNGTNGTGIRVANSASADNLTITAVDATGGQTGISALNSGRGATTVTSTGSIVGTTTVGIDARTAGTDITINAVEVSGGSTGIFTSNTGLGETSITTTGSVAGTTGTGIDSQNSGNSTDLTINAVDVIGGQFGISAWNIGIGETSVTTSGNITGTNLIGIFTVNGSNSTNTTINAVDVTGGQIGISASNDGTGSTSITSTGTVTGTNSTGILAQAGPTSSGITVTAVNVIGGASGIYSSNGGTGATTVSVTGAIAGGTGVGIGSATNTGNLTTINLGATSTVGATSGNAIANNFGNSIVNVANGAVITGTVLLNDGSDTFNVAAGTNLAGITYLNGGDDVLAGDGFVDNLNLNGWTGNLNGANILNWEFININGGTVGFSDAAITAGQINVNNFGTFNGSNNLAVIGNVAVASGSNLIAGNATGTNAMLITGNLSNFGNVRLTGPAGQQAAGDTLTVTGNYVGNGGTLFLDTVLGDDLSATDMLLIGGSASGSTGITVNNVGGLGAMTIGDGIMLVDVSGVSAANAFSLNNSLSAGAFNYFLYQNGVVNPADGDWYLRSTARGITSPAMVLPDMGNKAGLSILGTLQERLGARSSGMEDGGAWVRVVGNAGEQTYRSSIGDFQGRNDSHMIQAGVDFLTTDSGTRLGAYVAATQSTSRMFDLGIDPEIEAGRAHLEGYAVGAYATHYGDNYYWDAVIQHAWLDATANGAGDSLETENKNWLASFEFGRAFKFGNNNALEPQVQVIAGKGSTNEASDGFTNYSFADEDALLARLGVRWSHSKDQGSVKGGFVPYLKANVWRNFGDDSVISIGPSTVSTERDDTWAEVGFGFSVLTQHDWTVFLQYDYERGIGNTELENHSGTIGLRRSW